MKTRTSVLTGIIVITVALILIFISCDNGGADSYFIYDDHTYPLSAAYLGVVGPRNGAYSLSFNAFSSGIDVETEKGIGEAIFISIISPTSSLAEGTYTFAALISTTPFTFDIYDDPDRGSVVQGYFSKANILFEYIFIIISS